MLAILGVATIIAATVTACLAERTSRVAQMETLAGLMLIGGLSTIGTQFAWAI